MDLQAPTTPNAQPATPLFWRRVDGDLLVTGEIDESSSGRFAEALDSLSSASPVDGADHPSGRNWLLDLSSTTLLAAAGVTALVRWLLSLADDGGPTPHIMIVPSPNVEWVLDACRLGDAVPFCQVGGTATVDQAPV